MPLSVDSVLASWNSKLRAQRNSNLSKSSVNDAVAPENMGSPVYYDSSSRAQGTASELDLSRPKIRRLRSKTSRWGRGNTKSPSNASGDSFYTAGAASNASRRSHIEDTTQPIPDGEDIAKAFAERAWKEDPDFIGREELVEWLGSPSEIRHQVLGHYIAYFDFGGSDIDEAIRQLCNKLYIKGETEQIDRVLEAFSEHYMSQNPESLWQVSDIAYVVSFAIVLLNTDLQAAELNSHITSSRFVENTVEAVRTLLQQEASNSSLSNDSQAPKPLGELQFGERWYNEVSGELSAIYNRIYMATHFHPGPGRISLHSPHIVDPRKAPLHKFPNNINAGKDHKSGSLFTRFAHRLSLIRRRSVGVTENPEHNSSDMPFNVNRPTVTLTRGAAMDLAPARSPMTEALVMVTQAPAPSPQVLTGEKHPDSPVSVNLDLAEDGGLEVLRAQLAVANPEKRNREAPPEGNEPVDVLQLHTPQHMALMMYECLIEHGCPDLTSLIDPLGFSSSAVAEGGFGDIWKGRFHDSRRLAIKVLRFACLTGDNTEKELKRFTREIYHWSKLDHENVNKLMGVTMFRERLGVVSEWMEHGNLRQYLHQNSGANRPELCIQIAKGVVYLHGVNMIHGDLKACNILVSSGGILKITDFDYSIFPECSLAFSATNRTGGGTLRWMAPELVVEAEPPQRNPKTDIYALGMTFLETMTNTHPFCECRHDNQIYSKLARKEHPKRSEEYFPDNDWGAWMWSVLLQCWDFNPASRPTADDVLRSLLTLENGTTYAS
ncbi:unnamed protein product [Rhizoctonia solani]|uniref:Uncharacterized protein n=1 Tax=Rhizoctonia solani TaxID=456999 RepID=A0A8H3DUN9_9AGAM|nr:unnamed protein product [Rhizoctonia solani]